MLTSWAALPHLVANIISTTSAFCISFFANRRYTFRSTHQQTVQQFWRFSLVTLSGLWIIQSGVLAVAMPLLQRGLPHDVALLVGKIIATATSLVWNFVLYRRIVFR